MGSSMVVAYEAYVPLSSEQAFTTAAELRGRAHWETRAAPSGAAVESTVKDESAKYCTEPGFVIRHTARTNLSNAYCSRALSRGW